ncbi:MAG: PVC-type heme-binding CxxCH protein [Verrucomicrobiota bacterium]
MGARLAAQEEKAALPTLTAAPGWTVELVAGPPLVDRPVEMSLSPDGRLFVTEVSGTNDPVKKQLIDKPHRLLCLRDTDGDGKFDSRSIFADGLSFPEGCLWFAGSIYVAAPPVIWKFTDKDGDGVAEERAVWYDGKTLTGCANDLHGPYAGPDGWIYWGKGGFAKQTHPGTDGKVRETAASHIMRARPDGSQVEAVMNGGMDNPVGITWTADGECILSNTFLQHPGGGKRDGLIHAVENGLWGKDHDIIQGLPITGPLMPIMTHMGPAAPCGLATLRTGEILACQFNMRKVSRHELRPEGATFATADSDFLISENPDFHPTDVLEDRDGSVLVVDTGGWYKICCPTSQIAKPQVTGGIYRLRRTGGAALSKSDPGPATAAATPALSPSPGETAADKIWAAVRRGDAASVRAQLLPGTAAPARAAALAAGRLRDREAVPALLACLKSTDAGIVRAAAEALGRCAAPGPDAVQPLLEALRLYPDDRFIQHSVSDSIRLLADDAILSAAWKTETSPAVKAALLYAAHSRGGVWPDAATVLPCLATGTPKALREAALRLCQDHRDWAEEGGKALGGLTADGAPLPGDFVALATAWMDADSMRGTVARWLDQPGTSASALKAIRDAELKDLPAEFPPPLLRLLERGQGLEVVATLKGRARQPFVPALEKLAHGTGSTPPNVQALRLLDPAPLDDELFAGLLKRLPAKTGDTLPEGLGAVLAAAPLTTSQRAALLKFLPLAGPVELPGLVAAVARQPDEAIGLELLHLLDQQHLLTSLPPELLTQKLAAFPAPVKAALKSLQDRELAAAAARRAGLTEIAAAAAKSGDAARGHLVFQSAKAACATCHQIGYKGGALGPDLSNIGAIRTELDLLEAVTLPSAGFVRSYEPLLVKLKDGSAQYGIQRNRSDRELTLGVPPDVEIRIPLTEIVSTESGEFSLMPAGFGESLTRTELTDLVAFLKSLR